MSFINPQKKEINCKIAYYGAPFAGKSTSLHYVCKKSATDRQTKVISLSKEGDQTLFFDFLPLSLGKIKGYKIRFHLYTIPGQVLYDSARTIILKGIDGIIFVVDSRIDRLDENLESWKNLELNLKNHDIDIDSIPIALQLNKRDLPNCLPAGELVPFFGNGMTFETIATKGKNVMPCFKAVAKKVLAEL